MIPAHAAADVRAAEAALLAGLPPGTLMQRAAAGLAAACVDVLGRPYGARVLLLVGSGDNGGDALFAGARLAQRGARVDAVLLGGARTHAAGWTALRAAGGRSCPTADVPAVAARAHLVVDGIVGIGGSPGLRPDAAEVVAAVERSRAPVVAVDLPSGVDVDTGETSGPHVTADLTVTFGRAKAALLVDPAAAAAGALRVVDIGLGPHLAAAPVVEALEDVDIARLLPRPERQAHKYSRGVVGVLAGSAQYAGAAVLCVGGAVRGGAGMVRYVGAGAGLVRGRWPEAVVGVGRVQSWVAGPGLAPDEPGPTERSAPTVAEVLEAGVPVVVDAGALAQLPDRVPGHVLLTPHAGELATLLGVERAAVEARRLHWVREAARRTGATVLLKGSTTLVATPGGRVRANRTGTPALATAGSGDVLAGFAGALLAAGLDPLDAGSVAAHLHGLAGQRAARTAGSPSATDLLDALPAVLHAASAPTDG